MKRIVLLIVAFVIICTTFFSPDAFAAPWLDVSNVLLNAVAVGYTQPAVANITIRNTGDETANISHVTVSDSSFTIVEGDKSVAPHASNSTWTVQLNVGLTAGPYAGLITVAYDNNMKVSANVSIFVKDTAPSVTGSNTLSGTVGSVGAMTVNATVAGSHAYAPIDLTADIGGKTATTNRIGDGTVFFAFAANDLDALAAGAYDITVSSDASQVNPARQNAKVGELVINSATPSVTGNNTYRGTAGSVGAKTVTATIANSYNENINLTADIGGKTVAASRSGNGDVDFDFAAADLDALAVGTYDITVSSDATTNNNAIPSTKVGTLTVIIPTYTLTVTPPTFDGVTSGYARPDAKPVIITNSGNSAATITNVESNSPDFEISGSGETVTVGGSISTWMVRPVSGMAVGNHSATITVTYNGGATATANVSFSVNEEQAPNLNVAEISFGTVTVGYAQPAAKPIAIANNGNSAANISGVTVSGSAFTIGGSGGVVPAGGSISTWMVQPKAGLIGGMYTETITVTYNGGATATANVSFSVNEEQAPNLNVAEISFGTVTVGYAQPAAKPIAIANNGNSAANISGVTVSGSAFTIGGSGGVVSADEKDVTVPPSDNIHTSGDGNAMPDTVSASEGDGAVTTFATWTVQPKAGLKAGTYSETITVTYDGGAKATANVYIKVKSKSSGSSSSSSGSSTQTATCLFEIQTPYGLYKIPARRASLIPGLDQLLADNNLKASDITIKVTLTDQSEDADILRALENSLPLWDILGAVVDVDIIIVDIKTGNIMEDVGGFADSIVKLIPMPKDMKEMPEHYGAFEYDETVKEFVSVPHDAVEIDNVWYVAIWSETGGVFVAADNPMSFDDVAADD